MPCVPVILPFVSSGSAPGREKREASRIMEIRVPPSDRATVLCLECTGPAALLQTIRVREFQMRPQ